MKKYLKLGRIDCGPDNCGSFITKNGLLGHMKRVHGFSSNELLGLRFFLREKSL